MNINLHIERIVLDGVSIEPHQRADLKAAVELELGRLLIMNRSGSGVLSDYHVRAVYGGTISIGTSNEPSHLGLQIAGAIFRGIVK